VGDDVEKMAEILKSGASMLRDVCPQCYSPLFKLSSGEVYCAKCDRRVVIVKGEEEALRAVSPPALSSLEETILRKLVEAENQISAGKEPHELQSYVNLMLGYLDILLRIKKVRESR